MQLILDSNVLDLVCKAPTMYTSVNIMWLRYWKLCQCCVFYSVCLAPVIIGRHSTNLVLSCVIGRSWLVACLMCFERSQTRKRILSRSWIQLPEYPNIKVDIFLVNLFSYHVSGFCLLTVVSFVFHLIDFI